MDQWTGLDAMAQAELVRRREVSPLELVEAAIARIERVNPRLNAVITRAYDQARAAVAMLPPDARFAGVPFLLKDLVATQAGVPQSGGSAALAGWVPTEDSELVTRYKRAGLVILGKTNTPEFGIPPTTEPRAFGPTHNPWDPRRTPGGSSGGSAAAVAAGLVAAAHANDGGGSIRIPASCCGIFGLKPTRGRNPLGPAYGDMMSGLVCEHVVSRSVRDSAALLDVTAGPDVGDPYWAPPAARPYLDEVSAEPGRLRIAFTVESPSGTPVHPDCAAATREAATLCAALGHDVDEAGPEVDQIATTRAFLTLYAASAANSVAQVERATGHPAAREHLEPLTRALAEMGNAASAASYLLALEDLQRTTRAVARFFLGYDIWLTPVLAEPPVPLGTLDATEDEPMKGFFRAGELCPFTPICNVTGQPAMSVPLFWNDAGLPIGSHFVARFGDEATLFRLAAQLEAARPWAQRRPPIFA